MSKKTQPRKEIDARRKLRPVSPQELEVVTGGYGVPGQYKSSTGGGGSSA